MGFSGAYSLAAYSLWGGVSVMPVPDDNDWLRRLMFLGYGDWIGCAVAAIVSLAIAGLYYLFTHL